MLALLQRVTEARVIVEAEVVGAIGSGLMVLLCAERGDTEANADRLIERLLAYRVFSDEAGRMNRSLRDIGGGLLLVPQFTLAADTTRGNRPSFTPAAEPARGRELYDYALGRARALYDRVESGVFGAHMQVQLVNDGPVTFMLRTEASAPSA